MFPWLSIRSKLLIAFAGLSIIPLVLVGVQGIVSNANNMKEIALENLNHDVRTIKEKTANFLENIKSDLRVLAHSSMLIQILNKMEGPAGRTNTNKLQRVAKDFVDFATVKGIYYQFRLLDQSGDEILRIEPANDSDSTAVYHTVPQTELRNFRESYYFLLIKNLTRNQIAFAPAELVNQHNERIPVISFAMPLFARQQRIAILIANVYGKNLFNVMEGRKHYDNGGKVVLVTGEGHYIYHSEKKRDWNRLLASREEDNLYHDYPLKVVTTILSGRDGTLSEDSDEIISFAPLFTSQNTVESDQNTFGFAVPIVVFESVSQKVIMGPVRSFVWTFVIFLLLFLASAIGLGLLATQQFTKPIAELQRGAEIIAKGKYDHRLQVETHDEIEKLADQFNVMASSLEAHEKEIQQHRTKLEEIVAQRTHELVDEKTKLQVILDNVPSCFVLLDKNFRIQTASAAFSTVTGYNLNDVKNIDCKNIFCESGFCHECICKKAVQSGAIESHVEQVSDKSRGLRYFEHIAIPIQENGEVNSIIEIITDVTKRKRLEEHLIQTEKLMAAGEISSIIAHEFRNSLTSIKMILQLQHESKYLHHDDKKSLSVALDSIYHMESIVTELLNFARPSPMEFQTEQITKIIEEALEFIRLRIQKENIYLRKSLDLHLPPMFIDSLHLKDAIVNVILNGIQAIESKAKNSGKEEISLTLRKTILSKTIHDFAPPGMNDFKENELVQNEQEIILPKDTECVILEISDTGPGINKHDLRRIFDPFFTTKTNGTGLGLPMVKRTVNAHGGIVTVKSAKGKGTTFEIVLPIKSNQT